MPMKSRITRAAGPLFSLLLVAVATVSAPSALAQSANSLRIRGTIESFDGKTLVVASREGKSLTIALAPDHAVSAVKGMRLADIKAGDFIGTASAPAEDGSMRALEVTVFPESARGAGEGNRPWDLSPGSSMTNATISSMSGSAASPTLTLTYKGGQAKVDVPANAPVVTFEPGDDALLQAGKAVFVFAEQQPDGSLTAKRVTVEKDGVKPPM
jgi:Domain of unknown function (DUF5666)